MSVYYITSHIRFAGSLIWVVAAAGIIYEWPYECQRNAHQPACAPKAGGSEERGIATTLTYVAMQSTVHVSPINK